MYTLRSRLILSHILPLLVIIPLVGLMLIYVLESQVFLPTLTDEMAQQAELIAALTIHRPELWQKPAQAERFGQEMALEADMAFVNPQGILLWSSHQRISLESPLQLPGLSEALAGEASQQITQDRLMVWVPVKGASEQLLGVVGLTRQLNHITDDLLLFRYSIAGVLLGALVLGGGVGLLLALNLVRPLHALTDGVYRLSSGERLAPLPEGGPEEVRLLLRAFNRLTTRLHALETARRRLLANLVHELGRPLGAMQAAVEALRSGADEDEAFRHELFGGIAGEIQRLSRHLDNLARLHDRIVGNFELKPAPLPMSEWLPEVISPWRTRAKQKELTWQSTIPPALPAVNADPDYLGQVVGNLLSNAIKYTPTGGTVSVRAGYEADELWLRVSDTGAGIPLKEQTKIFKPFYRSRAHNRFPQGMGLGLSIAQDITQAHGGRLEIESSPQGSHFTLFLPAPESQPSPRPHPLAPSPNLGRGGILTDKKSDIFDS